MGIFMLIFIIPLYRTWSILPMGNYLNTGGMGPMTMKFGHDMMLDFPEIILIPLRCIALAGAILLTAHFGKQFSELITSIRTGNMKNITKTKLFVTLCIIGYLLLVSVPFFFFDRYMLYFFPLMIIVLLPENGQLVNPKKSLKIISGAVTFAFMAYSIIGTHDYFAMQRTRWDALHYLVDEQKISPHKIDGGYEFNGWYIGKRYPEQPGKSWWYVDGDDYIISPVLEDWYDGVTYSYTKYYPFGDGRIYILHKIRY